jgi:hypothetical protein
MNSALFGVLVASLNPHKRHCLGMCSSAHQWRWREMFAW